MSEIAWLRFVKKSIPLISAHCPLTPFIRKCCVCHSIFIPGDGRWAVAILTELSDS